jgi:hypothetical protein
MLHPLLNLRTVSLKDDIITIVTLLACIFVHRLSLLLFGNLLVENVVVVFDYLLCKLVINVILRVFFLFEVFHVLSLQHPEIAHGVFGKHLGVFVHSGLVEAVVQLFIEQLTHEFAFFHFFFFLIHLTSLEPFG